MKTERHPPRFSTRSGDCLLDGRASCGSVVAEIGLRIDDCGLMIEDLVFQSSIRNRHIFNPSAGGCRLTGYLDDQSQSSDLAPGQSGTPSCGGREVRAHQSGRGHGELRLRHPPAARLLQDRSRQSHLSPGSASHREGQVSQQPARQSVRPADQLARPRPHEGRPPRPAIT